MKYSLLLSLCALLLFSTSCEKQENNPSSSLQLQFNLTYDGQPLAMFQKVSYPDGSSIFFDKFNLFLSDCYLVNEEGKTPLLDVKWLDFTDLQDVEAAKKGITLDLKELPSGNYTSLTIGIGLSPAWNATKPSDYKTDHPLANNYWEQWNSYISMLIEGKADTLGNGVHNQLLTYHIGKDPAYSEKTLQLPISIEDGKTTKLYFEIDVKKLLVKEGTYLDIRKTPIDHSTDPKVYDFIRTNMPAALSIQQ